MHDEIGLKMQKHASMAFDRDALVKTLHAQGPAPDRAAQMMLYGQFIGSWDGRLVYQDSAGARRQSSCEVHFGWVLEGRAVQDVWIAPARHPRTAEERDLMHGTTLRVYDPTNDVWRITWIDPVRQAFNQMDGRKVGDEIVQEYRTEQGNLCQWRFTEITVDSFHWIRRESMDGGESWRIQREFFLRRRAMDSPPHQPG